MGCCQMHTCKVPTEEVARRSGEVSVGGHIQSIDWVHSEQPHLPLSQLCFEHRVGRAVLLSLGLFQPELFCGSRMLLKPAWYI